MALEKITQALAALAHANCEADQWRRSARDARGKMAYAETQIDKWLEEMGAYAILDVEHGALHGLQGSISGQIITGPDTLMEPARILADGLPQLSGWLLADYRHDYKSDICRAWNVKLGVDQETADHIRRKAYPDPQPAEASSEEELSKAIEQGLEYAAKAVRREEKDWQRYQEVRTQAGEIIAEAWPELLNWANVSWWEIVWLHGIPSLLLTYGPGPEGRKDPFEYGYPPKRQELVVLEQAAGMLPLKPFLGDRRPAESVLWHINPSLNSAQRLSGPATDPHHIALPEHRLTHAHIDPDARPEREPDDIYFPCQCSCGRIFLREHWLYDYPAEHYCPSCVSSRWLGLRNPGADPFKKRMSGPPVGKGWHGFLRLAGQRAMFFDPYFTIDNIKEKYGTLSFYTESDMGGVQKLVNWAEGVSEHICERCGASGQPGGGYWVTTACSACAEENPQPARVTLANARQLRKQSEAPVTQ